MTAREDFEEWTRLDSWKWDLSRDGYAYIDNFTTCAWRAWEARSFGTNAKTFSFDAERKAFTALRAEMLNMQWAGVKS